MENMKYLMRRAAILLLAVTTLAACGGDDDENDSDAPKYYPKELVGTWKLVEQTIAFDGIVNTYSDMSEFEEIEIVPVFRIASDGGLYTYYPIGKDVEESYIGQWYMQNNKLFWNIVEEQDLYEVPMVSYTSNELIVSESEYIEGKLAQVTYKFVKTDKEDGIKTARDYYFGI